MSQAYPTSRFEFDITATTGSARTGELTVGGQTLKTPNLFPVINFYGGGTENSVYGGGIHRTLKELMIGAERVGGESFGDYFDGSMMSVASLTDYNLTKERYDDYLEKPIKERRLFESYNGLIFVDSGGFKFLNNGEIDGSDFEVEMDQAEIYAIQRALGGDILVNLDHPITPEDSHQERLNKAEKTAENIYEFLSLSNDFEGAKYLTLHGYNYSMMDEFLDTVTDHVPAGVLYEGFDGIALGSLVPKKDNRGDLIKAVTDCKEIMDDWGMQEWPLHVLGISSRAIPLLATMGVDTFDSSSHLHSAINGKYHASLMETEHIDDVEFSDCGCQVCQSELLVNRMKGSAEYQKDILGPVAMHNIITEKDALAEIRHRIQHSDTDGLTEYLEESFNHNKTMRKFTHQVVNESLGGYF